MQGQPRPGWHKWLAGSDRNERVKTCWEEGVPICLDDFSHLPLPLPRWASWLQSAWLCKLLPNPPCEFFMTAEHSLPCHGCCKNMSGGLLGSSIFISIQNSRPSLWGCNHGLLTPKREKYFLQLPGSFTTFCLLNDNQWPLIFKISVACTSVCLFLPTGSPTSNLITRFAPLYPLARILKQQ